MRFTFIIAMLAASASCVSEPDPLEEGAVDTEEVGDEPVDEDAVAFAGTVKPADVYCDGEGVCWDQEWHACGGYNYRARVYFTRHTARVFKPYGGSVEQFTGDKTRRVEGLDWQMWLKNDGGLLGATTYHNDDDSYSGFLRLTHFDPARATHPYVEFLAGKSQDGEGSCWFRIYLYGAG